MSSSILVALIAVTSAVVAPPPHAAGGYSHGCLIGAERLEATGPGLQRMRPERNRFWGHPTLVALLKDLGAVAASRGRRLLVGDLSRPRGGPLGNDHRSHQNGLDADVWFETIGAEERLNPQQSASRRLRSVLDARGEPNPERWHPVMAEVLRAAAERPEVERIFVGPAIKRALCQSSGEDLAWLRKLRPWWAHDDHFHLRLACPTGSTTCVPQAPPPPGPGCGPALQGWFEPRTGGSGGPVKPARKQRPPAPAICRH